jgi:hypothetical protein
MTLFSKALFTAAAVASLALSSEAAARRTVIDKGESIPASSAVSACTIGVACTPITLPFSFDFGTGLTNQAFIYNSGIVSFGQQIPLGVPDNADLTTLGVPVIAPLYLPGTTGVAGPYQAFAQDMPQGTFTPTLPPFGSEDFFVISFLDPSDPTDGFLLPYVHLILDPGPNSLQFEFIHGQSFLSNGVLQIALPDTTGRQLGYSLGNPLSPQQVLDNPPDIAGINAFTFPSGVPEPSSWTLMLIGFGVAGFALRRARATAKAAPPQFA